MGDYSLPFLMMIAKNMKAHKFTNVDIAYLLVTIFRASGQEAEMITDSDLEGIQAPDDLNIGYELFSNVAKGGTSGNLDLRKYVDKLQTIYDQEDK